MYYLLFVKLDLRVFSFFSKPLVVHVYLGGGLGLNLEYILRYIKAQEMHKSDIF